MHAQLKNNDNKIRKQNELADKCRLLESDKMQLESRLQSEEVKAHKA